MRGLHKACLVAAVIMAITLIVGLVIWHKTSLDNEFTAQPPASVWDSSPPGTFVCLQTVVRDYCVIALDMAPAACVNDPKCQGYLVPGPKNPWPTVLVGQVLLIAAAPVPNSEWPGTVFYLRNATL